MGLDMYAYKVRADLVGEQQVDIDVTAVALKAVGFEGISEGQYIALSEGDKRAYVKRRDDAYNKAQQDGLVDRNFAYWRKFNHLHGWMEALYRSKGGTSANFNCDTVRLMPDDLDRLESMATLKAMPPTAGFFFGGMEPFSDDDKQEVIDFVQKARQAISESYAPVYSSWW
jgi:hypothetical protein